MDPKKNKEGFLFVFFTQHFRKIVYIIVIFVHIILLFYITFNVSTKQEKREEDVFKMVDVKEFIPPPPEEKKQEQPKEEVKSEEQQIEVTKQETFTEEVIETEKKVKEVEEIDYFPQHKISEIPILPPHDQIRSKIVYPPLALRQGIEGVVILQLYIDSTGLIRKVEVLKDPGYGFAEAAKKAFEGLRCIPAKANGIPVAVMWRQPVPFRISK